MHLEEFDRKRYHLLLKVIINYGLLIGALRGIALALAVFVFHYHYSFSTHSGSEIPR